MSHSDIIQMHFYIYVLQLQYILFDQIDAVDGQ